MTKLNRKKKKGLLKIIPKVTLLSNSLLPISAYSSFDFNPHLEQVKYDCGIISINDTLERTLKEHAPQMLYRSRKDEMKSVVHWGQRKLMIHEIEFLTLYAEEGILCLYAGAAPGTHIPFLAELFPEIHFVLIDPAHFSIESSAQITIRQEFMSESVANEFKHMKTLFISDVRSVDCRLLDSQNVEIGVARDMNAQMQWYHILEPVAGLLKFRLPWSDGITPYLSGKVFLPVWGPQTTTESRLLVTTKECIDWDNKKYMEQLFYFNNITRLCAYKHQVLVEGLDYCYDCASEVDILGKYLSSSDDRRKPWTVGDTISLTDAIGELVEAVGHACNGRNRVDSSNYRTLKCWRRTCTFPLRVYDSERGEVIELELSNDQVEVENSAVIRDDVSTVDPN